MILWKLWCARNELCFQGHSLQPEQIAEVARSFTALFESHRKLPVGVHAASPSAHCWLPPTSGQLKLNVDAGFGAHGAAFGFVLRDHLGVVLLSGAGPLHGMLSTFQAELVGVWFSYEAVGAYFSQDVIIPTDCISLVSQLHSGDTNLSPFGHLLDMLKSSLFRIDKCSVLY